MNGDSVHKTGGGSKRWAGKGEGGGGGGPGAAAGKEARLEGRRLSTGSGLPAERRASPLLERGGGGMGRDSRRDGGLGGDGKSCSGGEGRGGCPCQKSPRPGAGAKN